MEKVEFKSEYTLKDVEKAINKLLPKELELVYLLSNNDYITFKHIIK